MRTIAQVQVKDHPDKITEHTHLELEGRIRGSEVSGGFQVLRGD